MTNPVVARLVTPNGDEIGWGVVVGGMAYSFTSKEAALEWVAGKNKAAVVDIADDDAPIIVEPPQ